MIETGRLCVKIAGRDAGKKCIIVKVIDENYVLIDGETRRRKCNIRHIEPLKDIHKLKSGSHEEVVKLFKKLGLEPRETKPKEHKERPKKQKKKKIKQETKKQGQVKKTEKTETNKKIEQTKEIKQETEKEEKIHKETKQVKEKI